MAPTLRYFATEHDEALAHRLDTLIPTLMDRADLDMWVLTAREYNEDPVLQTMLPETWLRTARRRTVVLFIRNTDGTVEREAVGRYSIGDLFPSTWDPSTQTDQWARIAEIVAVRDPRRIGVNTSTVFPLADGLSATERSALMEALDPSLATRVVSAETAAIGWLETRTPAEIASITDACKVAHGFLRRALSREAVDPGVTTTTDVEWWLRQQVQDAGLQSWFHPTCSVQRRGGMVRTTFSSKPTSATIEPGDLVHIDFGIVRGRLHTDQQQHGYVLRRGETHAPHGLAAGVRSANRLQDLLMSRFRTGSTGNDILAATRSASRAEAIEGLVYTHPIGVHGHAAGPTIGLWDQQDGVPGQGDYPMWPNTAYSIELQARRPVEEWDGQTLQFMLEEDAWFDGSACRFLDDRQTELWLI